MSTWWSFGRGLMALLMVKSNIYAPSMSYIHRLWWWFNQLASFPTNHLSRRSESRNRGNFTSAINNHTAVFSSFQRSAIYVAIRLQYRISDGKNHARLSNEFDCVVGAIKVLLIRPIKVHWKQITESSDVTACIGETPKLKSYQVEINSSLSQIDFTRNFSMPVRAAFLQRS